MKKEELKTDKAPRAIGPYSQGIRAGGFLFLSGQIPLDAATGEVVKGSISEQTRQALNNLKMVLEAAGSSMDDVVKTTVYLKEMAGFAEMNGVYGEFFKAPYPARATVEAAGLPKGAAVEIDAVAFIGR